MISKETERSLRSAVLSEEVEMIKKGWAGFSDFVFYAILSKEIEFAVGKSRDFNNATAVALDELWTTEKNENTPDFVYNSLLTIQKNAEELMKECTKIFAICNLWRNALERKKKKEKEGNQWDE